MTKTKLYIARHGKTMFNTLRRLQGWSDSPLTKTGEEGIRELGQGLREAGLSFVCAFCSDSGRAVQTMELVLEEAGWDSLSYRREKRIREWCFGSLDGSYSDDLFHAILPRTDALGGRTIQEVSYVELADAIYQVDTANWAEPWSVLKDRILTGFTDIANEVEQAGGGNVFVVCHSMTISTLMWLVDNQQKRQPMDNGSVSVLSYENGKFTIETVGDMTYRELGRKVLDRAYETK